MIRRFNRRRKLQAVRHVESLFHAVEIVCREEACSAVKVLRESRYLSEQAPLLPVEGCNVVACKCRYKHFNDRRTDPRRESDVGLPLKATPHNQRAGFGRRISDPRL